MVVSGDRKCERPASDDGSIGFAKEVVVSLSDEDRECRLGFGSKCFCGKVMIREEIKAPLTYLQRLKIYQFFRTSWISHDKRLKYLQSNL